jgi:hypothetical protein
VSPLYSTEPSTPKDDFACKPASFIEREESSDQAYVFWHAGATERREGLDCGGATCSYVSIALAPSVSIAPRLIEFTRRFRAPSSYLSAKCGRRESLLTANLRHQLNIMRLP